MYIAENKSTLRDKGLNLSVKVSKINNYLDRQKSWINKNSQKLKSYNNINNSQNKSFDLSLKQKSFDTGDRNSEQSIMKTLNSEKKVIKQLTPNFAKINQLGKYKFPNVSNSTSLTKGKIVTK